MACIYRPEPCPGDTFKVADSLVPKWNYTRKWFIHHEQCYANVMCGLNIPVTPKNTCWIQGDLLFHYFKLCSTFQAIFIWYILERSLCITESLYFHCVNTTKGSWKWFSAIKGTIKIDMQTSLWKKLFWLLLK